ncbi:LPS export ABC transporter permease LptF [Cognatiluteimonas telluris]|uniref:LPS export ABC transporter permease LptF n=1 Tax=Cognatiluteimonas telluris TaxID=1104775 RepID=UPI00140E85E5|nr:LPS export ABC transporter permease LptF [Lysobacter telluris]
MPKLDRYLFREFSQTTLAAVVVLLMVSLGGIFADVLGDVARGRVPAGMMLAQLGLQLIRYLPLVLPLGLMIGMLLAMGRLYRDAEMPVLTSIGIGPRRMLRPVLMLVLPVVAVIALCSLWWGPWAKRTSQEMIIAGSRSLLVAGLEPGRFTELPGGNGVVYVGGMSNDGRQLSRVFVYKQARGRLDVTTARTGALSFVGRNDRYLTLLDGFRVEGPLETGMDFRLMRYASNAMRMPRNEDRAPEDDPQSMTLQALFKDPRREAAAQLHYRIAPPLLALAFALIAVPLSRSSPRQARYGRILLGFLAYLVGTNLMVLGTDWLGSGTLPMAAGLWWLLLPLLAVALWMYFHDGRLRRGFAVGATR